MIARMSERLTRAHLLVLLPKPDPRALEGEQGARAGNLW
jgi:hypothetical protein